MVAFHEERNFAHIGEDKDGQWGSIALLCPTCRQLIILLVHGDVGSRDEYGTILSITNSKQSFLAYPKGTSRPPVPAEVPKDIAEDYTEACTVLVDSPKASAALSRRCLQHLLRTVGGVKHGDLASEIQEILDGAKLPSPLSKSIDAIRNIGNFSAHPLKSTSTGEILPVEPAEAEWNLDVLEALFDYYYVQPASLAKKRDDLNKKLASAGKPPLKS